MPPKTPENWTSRKLLRWTTEHFERKGIDTPRLAAEMLLAHVLGVARLRLYMEADRPASPAERATLRGLVERAARHEPVDYLVGKSPFFSLEFKVTPAVLIPRPSTETIVEYVIQQARGRPELRHARIADVCCGSGAIGVALARQLPGVFVVASDLYPDALDVARENAQTHGVTDRMLFRQGDLIAPLAPDRFQVLVSNPPYISDAEWAQVEPNVKDHEPEHALRGGVDGLDFIRRLLAEAPPRVDPGGLLLIEFAASQAQAVVDLTQASDAWREPRILKDHEELPRVLVAERAG